MDELNKQQKVALLEKAVWHNDYVLMPNICENWRLVTI